MRNRNIDYYQELGLKCPYGKGAIARADKPHRESEQVDEPTDDEIRAAARKRIRAQQNTLHAFAAAHEEFKEGFSKSDFKQDFEAEREAAAKAAQAAHLLLDKQQKYDHFNPDAGYFSVTPPSSIMYIVNRYRGTHNKHKRREAWKNKLRDDAIANASWFDKLLAFCASVLFGIGIFALGVMAATLFSFVLLPLSIIGIWFVVWFAPNLMPRDVIPKEVVEQLLVLENQSLDELLAEHFDENQQRNIKLSASINGSIAFAGLTLGSPGVFFYLIIGSVSAALKFGTHACKELVARGLSDRQKVALAVCAALICTALLVFCPPAGVASSLACAGPIATALGMAHFTLTGFAAGFASIIASGVGVVTSGLLAIWRSHKKRRYRSCDVMMRDPVIFPPGTEQENSVASDAPAFTRRSTVAELLALKDLASKTKMQTEQKEQQPMAAMQQQRSRQVSLERAPEARSISSPAALGSVNLPPIESESTATDDVQASSRSRSISQGSVTRSSIFNQSARTYSVTSRSEHADSIPSPIVGSAEHSVLGWGKRMWDTTRAIFS